MLTVVQRIVSVLIVISFLELVKTHTPHMHTNLSTGIGDLLVKHPLAITFLLRNIFGTKRIRQLETRQKCARLVALAAIASERITNLESSVDAALSDEDMLCQVSDTGQYLLRTTTLC